MQNIDIRFNASANNQKAEAAIKSLKKEYERLGQEINAVNKLALTTPGTAGKEMGLAGAAAAANYKRQIDGLLASQGEFIVQQKRITTASGDLTKKLAEGKTKFRDLKGNMDTLKQSYRDQIALNGMMIDSFERLGQGSARVTTIIPKTAADGVDNARLKTALFAEAASQASRSVVDWGKNTQWAGRQLTVGFTVPAGIAAMAIGTLAYDADQALTRIVKVYGDGASAVSKSSAQIRKEANDTARYMAEKYGQSAKDTYNMMGELAALGSTGTDLTEKTKIISRGQLLGELNPDDALKAARTLNAVYGQNNQQLQDSFNLMNAIENSTSLTMQDIVTMLPKAGATLDAAGVTFKEALPLFVAMKAGGIEAAEGANAIKSMTISALDSSKAAKASFKEITGKDLEEMAKGAKNGAEMFRLIAAEIAKLDEPSQRIELINKIFGKYRASTAAVMLKNMAQVADGASGSLNEFARATETAAGSSAEFAKSADKELQAIMDSPSNRIKRAIEMIKIEAAQAGAAILPIVASIGEAIAWLFEKFNSLPGPVKAALGAIAGAAALAGPILMLVGLIGNLAGNTAIGIIKFLQLTRVIDRAKWYTPEQKAALMFQELMEKQMNDTTGAANRQALALERLANEMKRMSITGMVDNQMAAKMGMGNAGMMNAMPVPQRGASTAGIYYRAAGDRQYRSGPVGGYTAPNRITSENMGAINTRGALAIAPVIADVGRKAEDTDRKMDKLDQTTRRLAGGFGTATFAAGGLLSMFTDSQKLNTAANVLMGAAMLSPLLDGKLGQKAADKFMQGWSTVGSKMGPTVTKGVGAAKGALMGLASFMTGPWGIAMAAGIGAVLIIGDQLSKKFAEIETKAKAVTQTAGTWSKVVGYQEKVLPKSPIDERGSVDRSLSGVAAEYKYNIEFMEKLRGANKTLYDEVIRMSKQANTAVTQDQKERFVMQQAAIMRASGANETQVRQASRALMTAVKGDVESERFTARINWAIQDPSAIIRQQVSKIQKDISKGVYEGNMSGWEKSKRWMQGNKAITALMMVTGSYSAGFANLPKAPTLTATEDAALRGNVQDHMASLIGLDAKSAAEKTKAWVGEVEKNLRAGIGKIQGSTLIQGDPIIKKILGEPKTVEEFMQRLKQLEGSISPERYQAVLADLGITEKDIAMVSTMGDEYRKLSGYVGAIGTNSLNSATQVGVLAERMKQLTGPNGWASQMAGKQKPGTLGSMFNKEFYANIAIQRELASGTLVQNYNRNKPLEDVRKKAEEGKNAWIKYTEAAQKIPTKINAIDQAAINAQRGFGGMANYTKLTDNSLRSIDKPLGTLIKRIEKVNGTKIDLSKLTNVGTAFTNAIKSIEQQAGQLQKSAMTSTMDIAYQVAERQWQQRQQAQTDALEKRISAAQKNIETKYQKAEEAMAARYEKAEKAIEKRDQAAMEKIDAREKAANQALDDKEKALNDALDKREKAATAALDAKEKAAGEAIDAKEKAANKRIDAKEKAAQKALEERQARANRALEVQQRDAQRAFDARQEAERKALDKRQAARRDAISDMYDNRVKKVNEAIEAERKAEEIRQKIFEAEQERIRRTAQLFNSTIDFNAALASGNIDEAAKIAANTQAQQEEWQVSDVSEESKTGSEKRIEGMSKQIEQIEKEKQLRLDALVEVEEKEKESLDRRLMVQRDKFEEMQRIQRENLDKQFANEREALERRTTAEREALALRITNERNALATRISNERAALEQSIANERNALARKMQTERDHTARRYEEERKRQAGITEIQRQALERQRKQDTARLNNKREAELSTANRVWQGWRKSLEDRQWKENLTLNTQLNALKTYIPRNLTEMRKHIGKLTQLYGSHGMTISGMATQWGGIMQRNFDAQMNAGVEDIKAMPWEQAGRSAADQMIRGAFGMTRAQAAKFIKDGTLPVNFEKDFNKKVSDYKRRAPTRGRGNLWLEKYEFRHKGGIVGGPGASDKGSGSVNLKPGERHVIAQDGEGVVNKNAMSRPGVRQAVEGLNKGKVGTGDNYTPAVSSMAMAMPTMLNQVMMGRMVAQGIFQGFKGAAMKRMGMDPSAVGGSSANVTGAPSSITGNMPTGSFGLPAPYGPGKNIKHTKPMSIPAYMAALYQQAAAKYGIPWTLLAGIGMEETHHDRIKATSYAGAQGPMQFMPATFAAYGVDGNGDGRRDIRNPADSVHSAANYLVAKGVKRGQEGVKRALLRYNPAHWYVNDVLTYAHAYGGGNISGGMIGGGGTWAAPTNLEQLLALMRGDPSAMGGSGYGGGGPTPSGSGQGAWTPYPGLPGIVYSQGAGLGTYQWMEATLRKVFPNMRIDSRYRPTRKYSAEGVISNHWLGRALDIEPNPAIYNWILSNIPMRNIRDLIFTPSNSAKQIYNGRWIPMAGVTRGMHRNHIHWAMRTGGIVPGTGLGDKTPIMAEPGEMVVRRAAARSMSPEMQMLINNWDKIAPKVSVPAGDFGVRRSEVANSSTNEYNIKMDFTGAVVDKEMNITEMVEDAIRNIEYQRGGRRLIR